MPKFTIEGNPVAKGRPRFRNRGNYVKAYTPKKTKQYEKYVAYCYLRDCGREMVEGAIQIIIRSYHPIPSSVSKRKRKAMDGAYHTRKPDFDNIVKAIMDGLNGVAFRDDSQVCDCREIKRYSTEPRVEVEINQLSEETF